MIRVILHIDFDCDSKYRYSPEVHLPLFTIKDYVRDYMKTYHVNHLELFVSQNPFVHYQYQFDVYAEFKDDGSIFDFYTICHVEKERRKLHFDTLEIF